MIFSPKDVMFVPKRLMRPAASKAAVTVEFRMPTIRLDPITDDMRQMVEDIDRVELTPATRSNQIAERTRAMIAKHMRTHKEIFG